jgi:serine/threonine protein kinase
MTASEQILRELAVAQSMITALDIDKNANYHFQKNYGPLDHPQINHTYQFENFGGLPTIFKTFNEGDFRAIETFLFQHDIYVIKGQPYLSISPLGTGTYGTVSLATDGEQTYALKEQSANRVDNQKELEQLEQMGHLINAGQISEKDQIFLTRSRSHDDNSQDLKQLSVMPYLGPDLKQFLNHQGQQLSPSQRVSISIQLIDIVQKFHQEYGAHRDIKPQNIAVQATSSDWKLSLLDVATVAPLDAQPSTIGTIAYLPLPEDLKEKIALLHEQQQLEKHQAELIEYDSDFGPVTSMHTNSMSSDSKDKLDAQEIEKETRQALGKFTNVQLDAYAVQRTIFMESGPCLLSKDLVGSDKTLKSLIQSNSPQDLNELKRSLIHTLKQNKQQMSELQLDYKPPNPIKSSAIIGPDAIKQAPRVVTPDLETMNEHVDRPASPPTFK